MTSYSTTDLYFPDSDDKPMADNTEQFSWIVLIKENLEILFADDPTVFVAGDLLWYPVRSQLIRPVAPDVLVAFGRSKGKRGSYKQWEEDNIPIQVVFETVSPSNTNAEMDRKLEFYQTYKVEEYYLYNLDRNSLTGWTRHASRLVEIEQINGWISPRLGIRFELMPETLIIYRTDGDRFLSPIELSQRADRERQRADRLAAYLRSIGIDPDQLPD